MAIAIILGVLAGAASFFPLFGGMKLARKATATSNIGQAGGLLLGVLGSFAILAVCVIICIVAFRDMTLPFTVAMAIALVVTTVGFGATKQLR